MMRLKLNLVVAFEEHEAFNSRSVTRAWREVCSILLIEQIRTYQGLSHKDTDMY